MSIKIRINSGGCFLHLFHSSSFNWVPFFNSPLRIRKNHSFSKMSHNFAPFGVLLVLRYHLYQFLNGATTKENERNVITDIEATHLSILRFFFFRQQSILAVCYCMWSGADCTFAYHLQRFHFAISVSREDFSVSLCNSIYKRNLHPNNYIGVLSAFFIFHVTSLSKIV